MTAMLIKGVGASPGAAIAQIYYIKQPDLSVTRQEGKNPESETERYENAKAQAMSELDTLYEKWEEQSELA